MSSILVKGIIRQTNILFANIENSLDSVTEEKMSLQVRNRPLWKQFYHLLHSTDQFFISPMEYREPAFHEEGMNYFGTASQKTLSKSELMQYFSTIRTKIEQYLLSLDDESLAGYPKDAPFTRLELILAQYRHVMYNIGIINFLIAEIMVEMPEYIGISQPIPGSR